MKREGIELGSKCALCGATENLQIHHWLYGDKTLERKWTSTLCVKCHQKIHKGHGVGKSNNCPMFDRLKEKFIQLSERQNNSRRFIADSLCISYTTAYLWDKKLGIKRHRAINEKKLSRRALILAGAIEMRRLGIRVIKD